MITELSTDIASIILGEFLSQKGLVQLDSAICCKHREKYLQLLKLVQFSPQFVVVGNSANWIVVRRIKLLSLKLLCVDGIANVSSTIMRPSLQSLFLRIGSQPDSVELDRWLATIANNCPRLQTVKLACIVSTISSSNCLTKMLGSCLELKHFHTLHIQFPPMAWKALCDRQVSILCVTDAPLYVRELLAATGPLPEATIFVHTEDPSWQTYVWNDMHLSEANAAISPFISPKGISAASYSKLCVGPHFSMFNGIFGALEMIQLHNCVDMDEQTFTIILQQPFVEFIDLYINHTVCSLASTIVPFGKHIRRIELYRFTAHTKAAVETLKEKLHPEVQIQCSGMNQIRLPIPADGALMEYELNEEG